MARYLTDSHKDRLRVLSADWDSYEDCADLDEMCIDGWYSLQQLRTLVEALTQYEAEIDETAASVLLHIHGASGEDT